MRRAVAAAALVASLAAVATVAHAAQSGTEPDYTKLTPGKPVIGIGFQKQSDGFRIVKIVPDSAAQHAGLTLDMVITHVDGISIKEMPLQMAAAVLNSTGADVVFTILGKGEIAVHKALIPNATE